MTLLQVMPADDGTTVLLRTEDITEMAPALAPYGIRLERWATVSLADDAGQEQVLAAYASEVERVAAEGPYPLVDVVRMVPNDTDPEWPAKAEAARTKF